ncbi:hypothetical protein [Hyalangium sp.]|uniref:hypothetical protein n=1 Tax=Hyalangium sp. TaxID=2028555 RepID=UPI002D58F1D0|nr:hypothetical protein [Hyalangium sp.]HYH96657.1 hypothetical protein [Hyalangium sp.]
MQVPRNVAILPYVRTTKDITINGFTLWSNTPANWLSKIGKDYTPLTIAYVDQRGKPVGARASILSRDNGQSATLAELRDIVVSLSSITWLQRTRAADCWVFESWPILDQQGPDPYFVRIGKFSRTIGTPSTSRMHPSPYTYPIRLSPGIPQPILDYFDAELKKPKENSIITSLSHFHRARFETPFFSLPIDDVETLWSGFEAYFHFPFPLPPATSRDQYMLDSFKNELKNEPLRQEFWVGLKKWIDATYLARCKHTHGSEVPDADLLLQPYDAYILHLGLTLAEALIRLRAMSGDYIRFETVERLNHLFIMRSTIDSVAARLRVDRKSLYPGDGTLSQTDFVELRQLLQDLVAFQTVHPGYQNNKPIADARMKLGLILSAWAEELTKNPPPAVNIEYLNGIREIIKEGTKAKKSNDEIDKEIALHLVGSELDYPESFIESDNADIEKLKMGGEIPFWLVVDAFIRLEELYIGYELR